MNYCVILDGTTLPGFDRDTARAQLASLIGQSEGIAAQLLSGRPRTVKANLDQATALRYVDRLRTIGVACQVKQEPLSIDLDQAGVRSTTPLPSAASFTVSVPPGKSADFRGGSTPPKAGKARSRLWLILGLVAIVGIVVNGMQEHAGVRSASSTSAPVSVASIGAVPQSKLPRPVLAVPKTGSATFGRIETKRGSVEISGRFAPDSEKIILVFTPSVPLDDDAPRLLPELAELLYGIRPSSSMQEARAGKGIVLGDPPKQFMFLPANDGNNMVGAVISPYY